MILIEEVETTEDIVREKNQQLHIQLILASKRSKLELHIL